MSKQNRTVVIISIISILTIFFAFCAGLAGAFLGVRLLAVDSINNTGGSAQVEVLDGQSAIIDVAEQASPAVVSIVITKDLPIYENYYYDPFSDELVFPRRNQVGTEQQEVGSGSGFIISQDGLIVTNRHVVSDTDATYTVILNDRTQLDAEVLGRDTILDIAILKVDSSEALPTLELGDSDTIRIGQTAVAIGNSLGEFSNTVSSGIISGLSRSIIASDGVGDSQSIEGAIQTDASINLGNSGGPLLDISGKVIGVNVAIAQDAENVGFAIPINAVRTVIESVEEFGEIVRPQLGVRYLPVDADLIAEFDLGVDHGALLVPGSDGEPAVLPGSAADEAGLQEGDVIISINNVRVDSDNSLQKEIQKYKVGEVILVSFARGEQIMETEAVLQKTRT